MSTIRGEAAKEKRRMQAVFEKLKTKKKAHSNEFYAMAKNYYEDGLHFYKNKRFIQAFEAFVIAWSYIDAGLKLRFFSVPKAQRRWFTA